VRCSDPVLIFSVLSAPDYESYSGWMNEYSIDQLFYSFVHRIRGLSKKYLTLFFPRKTSDSRLANLITVVGGTFMGMRDLLRPRPVRLALLGS
jgi:hypothetical protein